MNGWDLALLVIVGYVAVVALVRLMVHRRNQLLDEFRRRMKAGKKRKEADQRRRKKAA